MKSKMLILIMTVLALGLGACAKKSSKGTTRAVRNGGLAQQGAGSTSCPQNQGWGIVYDSSISGYDFTQRLIRFTNNPDIGYVESQPQGGQTGVDVQMTVRFVNGQLDVNSSRFLMRIIDDKSYSQGLLADIQMAAVSGHGTNGGFQATFRDQLGSINLQGQRSYQNQNFLEGVISYTNGSGQAETLGRFWIPSCALVGY